MGLLEDGRLAHIRLAKQRKEEQDEKYSRWVDKGVSALLRVSRDFFGVILNEPSDECIYAYKIAEKHSEFGIDSVEMIAWVDDLFKFYFSTVDTSIVWCYVNKLTDGGVRIPLNLSRDEILEKIAIYYDYDVMKKRYVE